MAEFLPKDPAKALLEVKEKLYSRLSSISRHIGPDGPVDQLEIHICNEINFISDLLDLIERS